MKKLALTAIGVAIVLVGFMAILYCIPCTTHCNDGKTDCERHEGCESAEGKCSGEQDAACGEHRNCDVKQWTDADGKCHKEVRVTVTNGAEAGCSGNACPMENGDHSGCCGCCSMKNGGNDEQDACCKGDSVVKKDSVVIKVRGKL